ncbi:tonB-system energizer ExbB [Bradyrhizobium sp. STM 3557]|uniref:tonB-system energizer ExbB n=1 Tax=Bradyrhizobium sp. STM 3557 TaxID=578920 RepID=UPI00388D9215
MMTLFRSRAALVLLFALTSALPASHAQQATQPASQANAATQPAAVSNASAPGTASGAPVAASSPAPEASTDGSRPVKSLTTGLHELSPWTMFLNADILVKAVMIGLALASLATWTILIAKSIEFSMLRRKVRGGLRKVSGAKSLAEAQLALGSSRNVLASLLHAAIAELRLSQGIHNDTGIKERAASVFAEITRAEARRVRVGMGLLATVGAISPFVGLFGTVWGIMNSFIGISKSQTTNLAVVAPGIAEALLATAIGLAAAIPAVIIYNHFSRVTKAYLELVNRASGVAGRLLSRDLDRSQAGIHSRAAE